MIATKIHATQIFCGIHVITGSNGTRNEPTLTQNSQPATQNKHQHYNVPNQNNGHGANYYNQHNHQINSGMNGWMQSLPREPARAQQGPQDPS